MIGDQAHLTTQNILQTAVALLAAAHNGRSGVLA